MRVIAGKAKGRRLKSGLATTRPMTDRMKESLFSALGELEGLQVLDLYAGSGALGLEALSRGAAKAIFIENSREAIVRLEENVRATGLGKRSEIQWADVGPTLDRHGGERVDLIFLDPPYSRSQEDVRGDLEALVTGGFLADEGRVVLHRPAKERKTQPLGLEIIWHREYGQSQIFIYTHAEEEEDQ